MAIRRSASTIALATAMHVSLSRCAQLLALASEDLGGRSIRVARHFSRSVVRYAAPNPDGSAPMNCLTVYRNVRG